MHRFSQEFPFRNFPNRNSFNFPPPKMRHTEKRSRRTQIKKKIENENGRYLFGKIHRSVRHIQSPLFTLTFMTKRSRATSQTTRERGETWGSGRLSVSILAVCLRLIFHEVIRLQGSSARNTLSRLNLTMRPK